MERTTRRVGNGDTSLFYKADSLGLNGLTGGASTFIMSSIGMGLVPFSPVALSTWVYGSTVQEQMWVGVVVQGCRDSREIVASRAEQSLI